MLTKLEKLMVGGALLLLPFFCNPFGRDMALQFEAPKLMAAFLLGNLCFALVLGRCIHWAFALVHAAFALSVLLTGFGGIQLYPFSYWCAACFLALYAVPNEGDFFEEKLWLFKAIAMGGILSAVYALAQVCGFHWPLHYAEGIDTRTPIAMLGQQTKLGAFLAPCAAVCLALRGRWFLGAALCGFVCLLTGSSFTLFSLGIGFLVVLTGAPALRPRWVVIALVIGILLMVVGPQFAKPGSILDDHGRSLAYRDTVKAWLHQPFLGYAPGSFQEVFHKFFQQNETKWRGGGDYLQAHNDYLQVLFEFGLLGFIPLVLAVGAILRAYFLRWRMVRAEWRIKNGWEWEGAYVLCAQGALAALLVNSLGNFPFVLSPHFLLGVLSAGILLRAARD